MAIDRSTDQRFFLLFFPLGHMAVDWGGGAVLLLAPAMALAMDLSALQVGLMLTAMELGAGMAYAPAGLLGDRIHRRGLLLLLSFWWVALGYLAASFAPGYWSVVALFTLAGMGVAAWHPVATGVMVEQMAERKAQALGVHSIGGTLSHVLAPLSVGFLLTYFSWQHVLQISVLPALVVGVVLLWWWRRIPPSGRERIGRADLGAMWREWRRPGGLLVAAMLVTYQMSFIALQAMTPLFLVREHDYSIALAGVVFAAMLTGGALASPFVGRASDTAGRKRVAVVALAGSGMAAAFAAFAGGGLLLVGALVVAGTLIVSVRAVMLAAAVDVSRGHESTALGVAFSIMDGVGAMGALSAGAIGSNDLRLAIAFASAMAFVSLGVALAMPSRLARRAAEGSAAG
jgi:FSR family fosmidomycin resistance protein-like MFS transporter